MNTQATITTPSILSRHLLGLLGAEGDPEDDGSMGSKPGRAYLSIDLDSCETSTSSTPFHDERALQPGEGICLTCVEVCPDSPLDPVPTSVECGYESDGIPNLIVDDDDSTDDEGPVPRPKIAKKKIPVPVQGLTPVVSPTVSVPMKRPTPGVIREPLRAHHPIGHRRKVIFRPTHQPVSTLLLCVTSSSCG